MAAAAATAAKLIERMLAIFGKCSEIVMGRAPRTGTAPAKERAPGPVTGRFSGQWMHRARRCTSLRRWPRWWYGMCCAGPIP
jgi:hypothetical protein